MSLKNCQHQEADKVLPLTNGNFPMVDTRFAEEHSRNGHLKDNEFIVSGKALKNGSIGQHSSKTKTECSGTGGCENIATECPATNINKGKSSGSLYSRGPLPQGEPKSSLVANKESPRPTSDGVTNRGYNNTEPFGSFTTDLSESTNTNGVTIDHNRSTSEDANVVVQRKKNVSNGNTTNLTEGEQSPEYLRVREHEYEDENERPLSLLSKLCFAVGGAPYQLCSSVIGFFLNIFLLEVAQIPPKYISIVLFGGKAWDAISDPMCGYLVNKTETRWGKMRPWILFTAPFACVSYFFLWYVPDVSDEAKLAYYFVMFCAFEGLLSGLHVPYTSLTMYISNKQKERDSATAYRMASEAIGVLVGVIVQGKLIEEYRTAGDDKCSNPDATPSPQSLDNQKWSYMVGSGVVVGIYMFCAITVFVGVREKKKGVADSRGETSFFQGLKIVFTYGPYVKAAMIFLFMSLAVSVIQGNLALYCTHSLDLGKEFSNFILVLLIVSICFMPVWQLVLTRYGKKTAYASGIIIFIPVLIGHLYLPRGNPYYYYATVAVAGLSISVSLLLPWSVLPDVLDLFMLEKKTRKDALFYSFYVFFNKFSAGLGLAISQLALEYGGYETGACIQPASVDLTLRMLVVPGPVLCLLIALIFLWSYPINERKRIEIKQEVLDIMTKSTTEERNDLEKSTMSYESIRVTSSTEF